MAKKSCITRNNKRHQMHHKYINKLKQTLIEEPQFTLFKKTLKKNSYHTRLKYRCPISGKTRSINHQLGLSRMAIKQLGFNGLIPGIFKKNW
ncbi:30S ribosomal protein S14 [Candidatus Vidania fulgoroideae]|nr:30S ribosomal protein S14 [Candidatus Vidania fulgoroideae]